MRHFRSWTVIYSARGAVSSGVCVSGAARGCRMPCGMFRRRRKHLPWRHRPGSTSRITWTAARGTRGLRRPAAPRAMSWRRRRRRRPPSRNLSIKASSTFATGSSTEIRVKKSAPLFLCSINAHNWTVSIIVHWISCRRGKKDENAQALVKNTPFRTYCVPILTYGSEIWHITESEKRSLNVLWNNTFRKIFNCCWRESPFSLQFYTGCLPMHLIIEQQFI